MIDQAIQWHRFFLDLKDWHLLQILESRRQG